MCQCLVVATPHHCSVPWKIMKMDINDAYKKEVLTSWLASCYILSPRRKTSKAGVIFSFLLAINSYWKFLTSVCVAPAVLAASAFLPTNHSSAVRNATDGQYLCPLNYVCPVSIYIAPCVYVVYVIWLIQFNLLTFAHRLPTLFTAVLLPGSYLRRRVPASTGLCLCPFFFSSSFLLLHSVIFEVLTTLWLWKEQGHCGRRGRLQGHS